MSKGDADAACLPVLGTCAKGMFFLDPTDTITFGYGRTPKESALTKETRLGHDLSNDLAALACSQHHICRVAARSAMIINEEAKV